MPHLVPVEQGLLASCYVTADLGVSATRCSTSTARPTRTSRSSSWPPSRPARDDVRETNRCRIHVSEVGGRVIVFAAIDNLWKGAAGQAVQDLNLMLGLPETEGLE